MTALINLFSRRKAHSSIASMLIADADVAYSAEDRGRMASSASAWLNA